METVVRAAVEKSDTGITASFLALAALGDVLAIASRLPNSSDSKPIDSGTVHSRDPVVHATMNLIWNYSHRNLSVAGIARQLGITRRKLERRFQAVRAETVQDVLVQCRLTRAKRMLRETRLPIKRIATAAGFSSPAYMARVFRNKLNTTPRQYRGAEKSVTGL
jgi:transcriptional regulator GlxA family with amidase domain